MLFMLAECQSYNWWEIRNAKLYICLHGYNSNKKIPKLNDTVYAKRKRDGSLILPASAIIRYSRHPYTYDGFFYNYNINVLVSELHDSGIDVKQLLPYPIFVSYMNSFRQWRTQLNNQLGATDETWRGANAVDLWVRVYALCVGVTTPYNQLSECQKTEFMDRFTLTYKNKMFYAGVSNLLNAGLGLFTRCNLKKGTLLGELKGQWYSVHEYNSNNIISPLNWTIESLDGKQVLVPDPTDILTLANDSTMKDTKLLPQNSLKDKGKLALNAWLELDGLDAKAVVLRLSKDVEAADEIFFYYGFEYWAGH